MAEKKPRRDQVTRPRPALLVVSEHAEEVSRLRARLALAERTLRQTGDPWAALDVLGIKRERGKKGRSRQELDRIVGLYINMRSAPGPCRPRYVRSPERLDLLFQLSAETVKAQRNGTPLPAPPEAAFFVPDCDVPMSSADALRNVAAYLGVTLRRAHDLLTEESKKPAREGISQLDAKRDLPARPR